MSEGAGNNAQKPVTECSLWDRAYDALNIEKDKSDRIAKYEKILSAVLLKGQWFGNGRFPLPPNQRRLLTRHGGHRPDERNTD